MPANTAPLNEAVGKNATYKTVPGQYYNPQTDAYEVTQGSAGAPNVQLSSGHMELGKALNVKVSAGSTSTLVPSSNTSQFRRLYGYAVTKSSEPHNFTVKVEHQYVGGTNGMNSVVDAATSATSTNSNRANTGQFDVRSMFVILTVTNGDASDRYYDGVIGGFR